MNEGRRVEVTGGEDVSFDVPIVRTGDDNGVKYFALCAGDNGVPYVMRDVPRSLMVMDEVDSVAAAHGKPVPQAGDFHQALRDYEAQGPYETPKSWLWDLMRSRK